MAGKSIVETSVKLTADDSDLVAKFQRADRESRRSMQSIDRQVDSFSRSLKKKFDLADIGKSVLGGLGIGSGFALAQQASEVIVENFKRSAEYANKMADASERSTAAILAQIDAKKTDDQRLQSLVEEQKRAQAALDQARAPKLETITNTAGYGAVSISTTHLRKELTPEESQKAEEAKAYLEEVSRKVQELRDKLVDQKLTEFFNGVAEGGKQAAAALEADQKQANALQIDTSKISAEVAASMARQDAETQKLADTYRQMVHPSEQYMQQIRQIDALQTSAKLSAEDAAAAIADLRQQAVGAELDKFFGEMDQQSKNDLDSFHKMSDAAKTFQQSMAAMWNDVSDRGGQAFAQIILTGQNAFKGLADVVAQSVLEIVARLMIINPIMNMIFGGMPGFSTLPAFWGSGAGAGATAGAGMASGGPAAPWSVHEVNEDGTELFSSGGRDYLLAGSRGGTVIPAGRTRQMLGGGSAPTIVNNYHIASGVTRAELMPILMQHARLTRASMVVDRRRRSAFGQALG